jgi:hypothetical protein
LNGQKYQFTRITPDVNYPKVKEILPLLRELYSKRITVGVANLKIKMNPATEYTKTTRLIYDAILSFYPYRRYIGQTFGLENKFHAKSNEVFIGSHIGSQAIRVISSIPRALANIASRNIDVFQDVQSVQSRLFELINGLVSINNSMKENGKLKTDTQQLVFVRKISNETRKAEIDELLTRTAESEKSSTEYAQYIEEYLQKLPDLVELIQNKEKQLLAEAKQKEDEQKEAKKKEDKKKDPKQKEAESSKPEVVINSSGNSGGKKSRRRRATKRRRGHKRRTYRR